MGEFDLEKEEKIQFVIEGAKIIDGITLSKKDVEELTDKDLDEKVKNYNELLDK